MKRRLVPAAGALAAIVVLSSCSSVSPPAASVNGEEISMGDFDELAQAFATTNPDAVAFGVEGVVNGDDARQVLTFAIQSTVLQQELADNGTPLEQAAVDAEASGFAESDPGSWSALPKVLQDLFSRRQAAVNAYITMVGTPEDEVAALYDQGISASGVACVSHILVATEAEADAVSARLADGEDFATVAAEVSIDPGSGPAGGVLTDSNTGSACTDSATFTASYVQEFVTGALDAEVGVPTPPVESDFGFHIILVRPFDEVQAEAVDTVRQSELAPKAAELFGNLDVSVSPSIGIWSPVSNAVEPLDSPLTPS